MDNFFLTDAEIQSLIKEPKQLGVSLDALLRKMNTKKTNPSYLQVNYSFPRNTNAGEWYIFIRQSKDDPFNFSCGMCLIPENRNQHFRLMRYNGKNHEHTNHLENQSPFYDFHIHRATERYQKTAYKAEDHYAEPTDRYASLKEAVRCLLYD